MVATQTQIRRDTAANLDAATPANAELAYDTTNKRLRLGDGTTQGGTLTPNAADLQKGTFTYAVAGGTANAITLTLNPALAGYSNGVGVRFRASANNTGSVTVSINGNSVNTIQKMTVNGLADLSGGEIIANGIYDLAYNGTNFVLINVVSQDVQQDYEFVTRIEMNGESRYLEIIDIFEPDYNYYMDMFGLGFSTNTNTAIEFDWSSNSGGSWISLTFNSAFDISVINSNTNAAGRTNCFFELKNPNSSIQGWNKAWANTAGTSVISESYFRKLSSENNINSFRLDANTTAAIWTHGYISISRRRV